MTKQARQTRMGARYAQRGLDKPRQGGPKNPAPLTAL